MFGSLVPCQGRLPRLRQSGGLDSLREEMDAMLSRFFADEGNGWIKQQLPSLDLSETDAAVEVHLDVPGFDAQDIEIQSVGEMLMIQGKQQEEKEEEGKTYHRVERRRGSFSRSVLLPCRVDEDKVDAKYRVGVLTITLPKSKQTKGRKIPVKE